MDEKDLVIKNIKHARCAICHIDGLNKYDRDLFFRRMAYKDFADKAKKLGYNIVETDFLKHTMKHIYVYQPLESVEDISSESILAAMIGAHRAQLKQMEESGETGEYSYTKKSDMVKTLIELRGKFEGAYTQRKSDLSKDFQSEMESKLQESIGDPDFASHMRSSIVEENLKKKRTKEEKMNDDFESQQ